MLLSPRFGVSAAENVSERSVFLMKVVANFRLTTIRSSALICLIVSNNMIHGFQRRLDLRKVLQTYNRVAGE